MEKTRILGIRINPQVKDGTIIQSILTMYGNVIRTRLGINEETDEHGNRYGIILLELAGDEEQFDAMQQRLEQIEGVTVKSMEL